jgi:hypothetical protein
VLEVAPWAGQLLYSTQRGGVHVWDLRARRDAWTLPCTPAQARPGAPPVPACGAPRSRALPPQKRSPLHPIVPIAAGSSGLDARAGPG